MQRVRLPVVRFDGLGPEGPVDVNDLDTPALVIDLDRVETNIANMATRCETAGVRLRPHTKTHKMPAIARLQVNAGAHGITCAKLVEAEVMADAGFDDILVAFPILGRDKLNRLARLRERARVAVSLDEVTVAEGLAVLGRTTGDPVEVFVEVDTGLHRMGREPGAATADLVERIAALSGIRVLGLLTHAGHAYGVTDPKERDRLVMAEVASLSLTQRICAERGVLLNEISVGSTPSVDAELRSGVVTEVRPGTYVFNDSTMIAHHVATEKDCAAHVVATVVSRPTPERFVIDAGTKTLAADGQGRPGWMRVAGRPDLTMSFLNEEHGVGTVDPEGPGLTVGDRVRCIPSHICPVVNLFDWAHFARGGAVVDVVPVRGRGRSQ